VINLMKGGNLKSKGYFYRVYMILPTFHRRKVTQITGDIHNHIKISFPTEFLLTGNNICCNMVISLLGFGMGFEIQSRS